MRPANVSCATIAAGDANLHSATTYTLLDIGGSLWGTFLFASAFLAPGYAAGRLLNLADFRDKSALERGAWSVALSFGLGTIIIVAAVWITGLAATGSLLIAVTLLALGIWNRRPVQAPWLATRDLLFFGGWTLFVIVSLVDIGTGSKLWMSVTTYDHSVRVALVDAVMRTGVVPVNPLYWPGHDASLRYYYFWYVTCGVVAKLAHISARQAFIASCVWPMVALVAMLGLYGKYLLGWRGEELRSRTRLGVVLLAVTGLDALVTLFNWLIGGATPGDMEWWSIDQVTSWLDTFLWVPHHAAALVCCLLTFLLLWIARTELRSRQRTLLAAAAGLSFASAFGLSIYIAIGFCLVMLFWLLRMLFKRSTEEHGSVRRLILSAAVAALVAAVMLGPYVRALTHTATASPGGPPSPHILTLAVRQMLDPDMLANAPGIALLGAHHPFARTQLSALILLLPGYLVEFGFFALAVFLASRLQRKSEGERTLLFLFFASLLSVSFLRSSVIATNDYGARAILLAQFFAIPLAIRAWETSTAWPKKALLGLALIGGCGTVYQAIALRFYIPWQQAAGNPAMRDLAERNYAMRDAYELLARRVPLSARVQFNTTSGTMINYVNFTHMLHAQRQFVTAGVNCDTGFGGEEAPCAGIQNAVRTLFPASGQSSPSPRDAVALCARTGIEFLTATRWDPGWDQTASWVYQLPVVVSTPSVRIVACTLP